MTVCAFAPSVWFLVLGASLVGVGGGSFLAVDWALMTDIIPKASAGRFMGISNVATATNGVVAGLIGYFIVDRFAGAGATDLGPRAAFLLAPIWFAIGAWLLRPVDEHRREDDPERPVAALEPPSPAPAGA
jgi:MFS family permease